MRGWASVLAIFVSMTPTRVGARPTSSAPAKPASTLWVEHVGKTASPAARRGQNRPSPRFVSPKGDLPYDAADMPAEGPVIREETVRLLGFSRNETTAAVHVTVRETRGGRATGYELVRIVATATDQVLETFRQGPPSQAPEWQAARPAEAWDSMAPRAELYSHRLDMSKSSIRMAVDETDKVSAESNKMRILIKGVPGGALGMTPVARLYDGRRIWLSPMRVPATPSRTITAEVEGFHSRTGMHIALVTHYTSSAGFSEKKTDVMRFFEMPGDPIGTTTIGSFEMTTASEVIGERRFGELNPEFKEEFIRFGRD